MPTLIDLTGQRFSELTVLHLSKERLNRSIAWVCLCDCGNTKLVTPYSLRKKDVTCCGKHRTKLFIANAGKGGLKNRKYPKGTDTHSRIYTLWRAILWRCYDPKHVAYSRYGGAGIFVCDEWLNFSGFRLWALASGYAPHLSVDRINNHLGYTPENCRWATPKEQARNRKAGLVEVEAFGESKPLIDWVADPRCKVSMALLRKRLYGGQPSEFAMQATESEAKTRAAILRERQKKVSRCMAKEIAPCIVH